MGIKEVLIEALYYFYCFLTIVIFVRCILSWFPINANNFFIRLINNLTEPILEPIRRLVEKSPIGGMMIDISPIIAYILLQIIFQILIGVISAL